MPAGGDGFGSVWADNEGPTHNGGHAPLVCVDGAGR